MLPATTAEQLPGHLAENVMHFGRVLRAAGLPCGTDRVQLALNALQVAGLESRRDFRATLAACMVDRTEHRAMFDQAFHIFWRDPDLLGRVMAMLLPRVQGREAVPPPPENRRLGQALFPQQRERPSAPKEETRLELDARLTWSEQEQLRRQDFETMTATEWAAAKRLLRGMSLLLEPLATRRFESAAHPGRVDWRATLRSMGRHGGELPLLRFKRVRERPAPIVVLADISGSMSRYSRMLLHFAHALAKANPRVHSFTFGTRLTPITRALRERDADVAVARVSHQVQDWSGGTRLAACLHDFNQRWARRTLDSRATVLLVTDGLEHGDVAQLAFEAERLAKSCRRLLWLNPLLRYEGFEPRAAGIRALLPHVSRLLPAHNLDSLDELAIVLSGRPERAVRRVS